jgi:hypothetical protein
VFELSPLHGFTVFVEEAAAVLLLRSLLADEAWLAARRVYANVGALVAVDALGNVFD